MSKTASPNNMTAASTLSRRRTHELSLRILAVADLNLSALPPLRKSLSLSSFPLPPQHRPATLNLALTDPSLARRPPTLPSGAIPSPRLSLSETEFVITTPRSPLPPTSLRLRMRAPIVRASRPRGAVFALDVPAMGHLLPSTPSSFLLPRASENNEEDEKEEVLFPPPRSPSDVSWDRSFDDGGGARSPLSPWIASDAGTGFSISSMPPIKLRRRLFEAVVGAGGER